MGSRCFVTCYNRRRATTADNRQSGEVLHLQQIGGNRSKYTPARESNGGVGVQSEKREKLLFFFSSLEIF